MPECKDAETTWETLVTVKPAKRARNCVRLRRPRPEQDEIAEASEGVIQE